MLKHATINRTSRAQQTLQLQRQCHLNQLQQQQQSPSPPIADDQEPEIGGNGDRQDEPQRSVSKFLKLDNYTHFQSIANQDDETSPALERLRSSETSSPIRSIASLSPNSSLLSTPTHRTHRLTPATSLMGSPSSLIYNNDNNPPITSSPSHRPNYDSGSMIKVFAQTLSQDVEYITLQVNAQTKSNQIIKNLLRKFRLKHRDPNLFYLTLERWIRKDGLKFKSVMLLGDEACPLQLQQCCSNPPHNDIKFTLQSRTGALVKIFCSDVVPDARYKCLSLSTQTTVEETIELMLHCLNLASQPGAAVSGMRTDNNNSHTTTTGAHHPHLHSRSSGSPSSTGSSSSTSDSSSTSGIESEPNNNTTSKCDQNGHSSLPTVTSNRRGGGGGLDVVDSASCHHKKNNLMITSSPMLDSESRTSSVTSISSTSNVSNISTSITDQYCMIIECKDTNYKRILEHDEYLVDVYQNLISEAKGQSTITSQYLDVANSNHLNISEPIKQQPEQWFHIKLKRRNDCNHNTIKFTSPRQNLPLPPIPLSLAQHFNNPDSLQHIVSMTQIEVNRRPNYISGSYTGSSGKSKATGIDLLCKQKSLNSNQTQSAITTGTVRARAPPPPEFITLPPVRPRRRNLSNASSTFGRPFTANRRRYDPAQLAEDLNKLNVKEVVVENIIPYSCGGGGQLLAAAGAADVVVVDKSDTSLNGPLA